MMNNTLHQLHDLFAQLGLPNDPESITQFVAVHAPLTGDCRLPDAPYWTPTQAAFLRESLLQDSDWAVVVDELSTALRQPTAPAQNHLLM